MRFVLSTCVACALLGNAVVAWADELDKPFGDDAPQVASAENASEGLSTAQVTKLGKPSPLELDSALELYDPRTYRLRVGVKIEAPDGTAKEVVAIFPIPIEWPEQRLRVLSEKATPGMKVTESVLKNQCGMMKVQVPMIAKGGSVTYERLYEITRYRTEFKLPSEEMTFPKQPPAGLRIELTKAAPGIETESKEISTLAKDLGYDSKSSNGWDKIRTYWSWTRDNVAFQNGDFRGQLYSVQNKCGDCEEMSGLFIGLTRLNGGLARTVWVEGHDYPEFYMLDNSGKGHWIPAQVVGPPWFGEITEYRPIFQKGDRFYDPFQKQFVRYAPQTVRADGGGASPKLSVIHDIIADSDINGPSYENSRP